MTRQAYWSDYGNYFNWKLTLAFLFVWAVAALISFSGAAGVALGELRCVRGLVFISCQSVLLSVCV